MGATLVSRRDFNWLHAFLAIIALLVYPFIAFGYYLSNAPLMEYFHCPLAVSSIFLASYWTRWRMERQGRKRAEQK